MYDHFFQNFLTEAPATLKCVDCKQPFHPKTGTAVYNPRNQQLTFIETKNGGKLIMDVIKLLPPDPYAFASLNGTYELISAV